jgi:hypothetical protein
LRASGEDVGDMFDLLSKDMSNEDLLLLILDSLVLDNRTLEIELSTV